MITLELVNAMSGTDEWYEPLRDACAAFEIDTPERIAAFLAQCAHESQGFSRVEENLNYSLARLPVVFPKYFTAETAKRYARKPEAIANRVYANRMGNGDEASGDGWRYRGRGLGQLTGKHNYRVCGEALGLDLLSDPDLLLQPPYAASSFAWYWWDNGLNAYADSGDFIAVSGIINVGRKVPANRITGLDDRIAWLDKVRELMA